MSQLQAILEYQKIDENVYKIERELASSDERKEFAKYKKYMEGASVKLDAYDVKAKSLNVLARELTKKYLDCEATLKEFENIDELMEQGADVSFYVKKVAGLVEAMKKIKAELLQMTKDIEAVAKEYQALKKEVVQKQKQSEEIKMKYVTLKAQKDAEKKPFEEQLSEIAKTIKPEFMEKYMTKRKEKLFPIIVQLKDGRCPKCGMEPAIAAVQKLTDGQTIECDNCHRVIYNK